MLGSNMTLCWCRIMGARVIVAAGSDDKVALALSRAGSDARGFSYEGCSGKDFRAKLKDAAGKGEVMLLRSHCLCFLVE